MGMMTNCRACRSGRLYMFLSLGEHPPAHAFLRSDQLERPEARWPLEVHVCLECGLIQVPNVLRADFFHDYVYRPLTSDVMHQHFAGLADVVRNDLDDLSTGIVVDIGSNDGLFLWKLHTRGVRALGIEPAVTLASTARERGVEVLNTAFCAEVGAAVRSQHGPAAVITATNTFGHVDDLHGFMLGVIELLDPNGTFIVEVPYRNLMDTNAFDTLCHEHLSTFSVRSLVELFAYFDMAMVSLERVDVRGGSLRVCGRRREAGPVRAGTVDQWLAVEDKAALRLVATYDGFAERVHAIKRGMLQLLDTLRSDGRRIAGYGASARASTLLNFFGLGTDSVEYLADRNTLKHGLFSPGLHIPVVGAERVLEDQPDYVLVLAWNASDEVMRQQKEYRRRGGTFILPLPEPRVLA